LRHKLTVAEILVDLVLVDAEPRLIDDHARDLFRCGGAGLGHGGHDLVELALIGALKGIEGATRPLRLVARLANRCKIGI